MKVAHQHRRRPARGHRELQRLGRIPGREHHLVVRGHQGDRPGRRSRCSAASSPASTTNPSAGTIELQGALGSITAKPAVVDDGLSLQVSELTGLGFTLPREAVQPALDVFTSQLTKNYPMGIKADSVQVTDTGVVSQFSTQNASIPQEQRRPLLRRALAALGDAVARQPVEHRAGARQPQPRRPGAQHRDGGVGGADAAAGLDAEAVADRRRPSTRPPAPTRRRTGETPLRSSRNRRPPPPRPGTRRPVSGPSPRLSSAADSTITLSTT